MHPATKHDDPVVTLHSLLDRDVYRGGAIVVGPVRRGRGRRVRVERRVLPVTADPDRRAEVFERELWRIAVEHLDYGEQHVWAALAGARVAPNGWRRAKAMLHFDRGGELKRRFLLTAVQRNRNSQLRLRALQEIAASRDAEAFDTSIDIMAGWPRDERREGVKIMLQALAERRIGRRDQANAWIWRMAEYTREVHEEYAVQRWPETKRLLGLLVNSSGAAHARNARRLVHAARKEDRRLSAALLAAALAHTPEAEEALRGARTRMARKPAALARELLRNFPKGRRGKSRRRRKSGATGAGEEEGVVTAATAAEDGTTPGDAEPDDVEVVEVEVEVDDDQDDDDDDDLDVAAESDDDSTTTPDDADDSRRPDDADVDARRPDATPTPSPSPSPPTRSPMPPPRSRPSPSRSPRRDLLAAAGAVRPRPKKKPPDRRACVPREGTNPRRFGLVRARRGAAPGRTSRGRNPTDGRSSRRRRHRPTLRPHRLIHRTGRRSR